MLKFDPRALWSTQRLETMIRIYESMPVTACLANFVFLKNNFKYFFFVISYVKILPRCCPIISPGIIIWTKLNLTYMWMFPNKFQLFWSNRFMRRRFFKDFLHIIQCKNSSLHWGLSQPQGPWLEQTWIYTSWKCLQTCFSFFSQMLFKY